MLLSDKRKAIALLSNIVKKDSEHINAYLQLGNLLREDDPDRATKIHQMLTVRQNLPKETKIYCGHEYTESNASFANYLDKRDFLLKKKIIEIKDKRSKSIPTVPFLLEEEMKLNPFLKFDNIEYLDTINLDNVTKVENFKKIRLMKDNF